MHRAVRDRRGGPLRPPVSGASEISAPTVGPLSEGAVSEADWGSWQNTTSSAWKLPPSLATLVPPPSKREATRRARELSSERRRKTERPTRVAEQHEWVAKLLDCRFDGFGELIGAGGRTHTAANAAQALDQFVRVHTFREARQALRVAVAPAEKGYVAHLALVVDLKCDLS